MKQIIKMQFGSQVYGTSVPESDTDYKGVFLPDGRDIVMQRACKVSINENTKKDSTKKNTADDVDFENFSLQGFLKLAAEGQTQALDMLFTPPEFIVFKDAEAGKIWDTIIENRAKILSSNATSFVGYCYKQAAKYGLKGSRLDALVRTIELLKSVSTNPTEPLSKHEAAIAAMVADQEHTDLVPVTKANKEGKVIFEETYLEVCGCKAGFSQSVKNAIGMFQGLYDKYGERARMAQANAGVDRKAVMHAVRVCHEAIELLTTGTITLPRPEAALLLRIRKGEIDYSEVQTMIEKLLEQVTAAEQTSTLPRKPDMKFIEELIFQSYSNQIAQK